MYRFQKFARKHKPALVTAAAIAGCLILGTTVSAWQAVRATTAEAQANANANQAQANSQEARTKAQEATTQRDEAQKQRDEAQRQRDEVKALNEKLAAKEQQLQRTLYSAHMNLAHNAWSTNGFGRMPAMLEGHRPKAGETDLRGFEWHYLNRLCHSDLLTFKEHSGEVLSVAFSPDGKRLASGARGDVKIWDAQTGQVIMTLKHNIWVVSLAFSHDGKRLATLSNSNPQEATVRVWDAETGQELFEVNNGGYYLANTVAFSPDGTKLASSSLTSVRVWDSQTGKELGGLKSEMHLRPARGGASKLLCEKASLGVSNG